LVNYVLWLQERNDLEAFDKLKPIVDRITILFMAICEGFCPEITPAVDAVDRFFDEISRRMKQASTLEEIAELCRRGDKMVKAS
jgi:hypothetical protein